MGTRTWCAAALLCAAAAEGNAAATDTLIVSGQSVSFSSEIPSGTAETLDWIHQDGNQQMWGLGTTAQQFAGFDLNLARVMGSFNLAADTSLMGTLEAGPGTAAAEHYTFTRATLEGTRAVSARLQISGGGQYVDADNARVLILRLESAWLPPGPVSVRAQLGQSVEGNLPTRFATLRTDYVRRVQIYGGVSVGRGAESIVEFGDVRYEHFTDAFVGLAVPFSLCTVGLSWDLLELSTSTRRTATLTLNIPLAWRR
jgi:hypothetical protein